MFGLFSKCRRFPTTVSPNGLIGAGNSKKVQTILRNLVRSRCRFSFSAPERFLFYIQEEAAARSALPPFLPLAAAGKVCRSEAADLIDL